MLDESSRNEPSSGPENGNFQKILDEFFRICQGLSNSESHGQLKCNNFESVQKSQNFVPKNVLVIAISRIQFPSGG